VRASIVITTWNHLWHTVRCLESLFNNTEGIKACEIIVVDNGSTDGTVPYLEFLAQQGKIRLIKVTGTNYAQAINAGIKAASKENPYIVLLNNDTWVQTDDELENNWLRGWLVFSLYVMDCEPSIGILAPMTNMVGNNEQFFTSPLNCKPFVTMQERVHFVCVVLRRAMIDKIGLIDEGFNFWFTDDEYCFRARKAGWRIGVNLGSFIYHLGDITAKTIHTKNTKYQEDKERYCRITGRQGDWQPGRRLE